MKKIGMIGGMSYESTVEYYRLMNELINQKKGGYHSAKTILYSVDFEEIEEYQRAGEWKKAGEVLAEAAKSLESAGADFIILCTNTMHKVSEHIEAATSLPFLHIADATAEKIIDKGMKKIGLLGTKYTMEQDFYKGRLTEQFGIEVVVPNKTDIDAINNIIFDELVFGKIEEPSKKEYLRIMDSLIEQGVEGIILGCTEIGLLIKQKDTDIPLFDTTYLHALKAVEKSLE